MRIAVPIWMNRVSPVFDVARELLLVDLEGSAVAQQAVRVSQECGAGRRVETVAMFGVDVLICCAVSQPLERMLTSQGVWVISDVFGEVDAVVEAFVTGRLESQASLWRLRGGHEARAATEVMAHYGDAEVRRPPRLAGPRLASAPTERES